MYALAFVSCQLPPLASGMVHLREDHAPRLGTGGRGGRNGVLTGAAFGTSGCCAAGKLASGRHFRFVPPKSARK
jgi:hypothetical protein